ncbi:MAG: SDR family NAD(P)-dependent oxidoreductase [Bacteroidales bacterium]|nr:SDR family NAD(P)-dependent oxidoreductase [Bacteroidales bacterium]
MIRNNRLDPKICNDDFKNKLVVITGATSGIGYLTARKYASMGADLLCVNRSQEKSDALKDEIEGEFNVKCDYRIADLSKLDDVHKVGQELSHTNFTIDVLIHNAGVYLTKRESTTDGLEKVFMVHHLSSFIINYYLVEKLKAQDKARIIVVSSEGHRFAAWGLRMDDLMWEKRRYSGLKSYGSAKTAQLLSILIFDQLFNGSGVTINAMHPGAVKTETGRENGAGYQWFKKHVIDRALRSPEISAEALYYLGVSDEMDEVSGKFFNLTAMEEPAPPALDMETARELWQISLDLGRLNTQTEKE